MPARKRPAPAPQPDPLVIELPLPPSVNNMYFNVPGVGRVPTPELRAFKRDAAKRLGLQNVPRGGWEHVEAVHWDGRFYVPTRGSDADNLIKAWQDFVADWFGVNDNKFEDGHYARHIDPDNPRVVVKLWPARRRERGE